MKKQILMTLLILTFAVLISGTACAKTINVNNSTANAIGNAINTASPGDTLKLSAGTYSFCNLLLLV